MGHLFRPDERVADILSVHIVFVELFCHQQRQGKIKLIVLNFFEKLSFENKGILLLNGFVFNIFIDFHNLNKLTLLLEIN